MDCRQSDGDQKIKPRFLHLTGSPQLENGVTVSRCSGTTSVRYRSTTSAWRVMGRDRHFLA